MAWEPRGSCDHYGPSRHAAVLIRIKSPQQFPRAKVSGQIFLFFARSRVASQHRDAAPHMRRLEDEYAARRRNAQQFTNDFRKTSSTRHAAAKEPVQISPVRRERERKS